MYSLFPQDLEAGPPSHFVIDEKQGTADVVLQRTFEGEDISVVVSFMDDEQFGEEELEAEGEEGEVR